ncbi:MAG: hypothetical protein IMZ69_10485 [Spirochaetes bacterium]|nr:hypothetical protein [Spirochaetota bacterium]
MERQVDARRSDLDWMRLVVVCVLAYLPIIILGGALTNEAKSFLGGLSWQSGAYALWEAVAGTSLFIVTFVLFARARGRPVGRPCYHLWVDAKSLPRRPSRRNLKLFRNMAGASAGWYHQTLLARKKRGSKYSRAP